MKEYESLLFSVSSQLGDALGELQTEEERLTSELAEVRADRKKIEAALSKLNEKPQTKPKKRPEKEELSEPPKAIAVLEYMKQNKNGDNEDWTAKRLAEAMGHHTSTINACLKWLRANNLVRATRAVQGGGHAYAPWEEA